MVFIKKDKKQFRDVVLTHLEGILELSRHELKNTDRIVIHSNFNEKLIEEDTRLSYIQAIENFSYILIPYFDEETQKVFDNCIKIIDSFDFEIKDNFKEQFEREKLTKDQIEFLIVKIRLQYAKKLFIALNLLLKSNDYLKSTIFKEEIEDEIVEEVGEDE